MYRVYSKCAAFFISYNDTVAWKETVRGSTCTGYKIFSENNAHREVKCPF